MRKLILDGKSLTLDIVAEFARSEKVEVVLAPAARAKVQLAHDLVMEISRGKKAVYGVNTGFGLLSDVQIAPKDLKALQLNLLRSHACGTGNPLSIPEARVAMLLRANTLAVGHSGCSPALIDAILNLINRGVTPYIPEQGSVGACGDLAPLAHMALVLIGEGQAYVKDKLVDGAAALRSARMKPHDLQPKEGLSLINGTQIMTAIGALVIHEARALAEIADVAGAMSLEAVKGTTAAFDPRIHAIRPHPHQKAVAENLLRLLAKSKIAESHKDCGKVQDPYSFRCMPQVHGACREHIENAARILEIEMNSVTDNPLVFPNGKRGEILSGGNFHGEYVAIAMDSAALGIAELANISDLRMQKLINPAMSGLPAFLSPEPGLNSGMMIVQVVAASLVSENKVLCHPASVDSIPTSADKEDHVSMGVTSARKARAILRNTRRVLAMELFCAAQGLDFLQPLKAGKGAQAAYELIRRRVKTVKRDRVFHEDLNRLEELLQGGKLLKAIEL